MIKSPTYPFMKHPLPPKHIQLTHTAQWAPRSARQLNDNLGAMGVSSGEFALEGLIFSTETYAFVTESHEVPEIARFSEFWVCFDKKEDLNIY